MSNWQAAVAGAVMSGAVAAAMADPLLIWSDAPGEPNIMEAYPVGNGRLGALVAGGVYRDRMPLCEDSVWSGGPFDFDNPDALPALAEARRLLFEGKLKEANELVARAMVSRSGPEISEHFGSFQTLGYLELEFPKHPESPGEYRRELDLARANASVRYDVEGVEHRREIFASHPDQVIVVRLTASWPGQVSVDATLGRPSVPGTGVVASRGEARTAPVDVQAAADGTIRMSGRLFNNREQTGLRIAAHARVLHEGGTLEVAGDRIRVRDADAVTILIAGGTDYRGGDPGERTAGQVEAAAAHPIEALRRDHEADYRRLFDRLSLRLGPPRADVPTQQRLIDHAAGVADPQLAALYLQFGRYLLISSSRPGDLAANLQGLWAENVRTPWNGDYHCNINVQMNYWPAEPGNLGECVEPLVDLIERMVEPGTKTVRTHYGMRGWTVHTTHNVWGYTSPGSVASWGAFPMAGPWMVQHLWEHYAFSGDEAFLRRAWPTMRGSGEFLLDWLVVDPASGKLVSGPTNSPENRFLLPDGSGASFTMGPAMDQEIAWDLLTSLAEAARVLGIDDDFTRRVVEARAKLKWPGIGSDGRLMEWPMEVPEADPKHRHVSHLFGLHPGAQFTAEQTPEYVEAARRSLEGRGDDGTGWSLAWKANFWARLRDGDRAERLLRQLFRPVRVSAEGSVRGGGSYPNLFCAHPPMQIDGNFGGAAAVMEMLVQSHQRRDGHWLIEVLPALPSAWPEGELRGVRVRGGGEVDVTWANGSLVRLALRSSRGGTWAIRAGERRATVRVEPNQPLVLGADLRPQQ